MVAGGIGRSVPGADGDESGAPAGADRPRTGTLRRSCEACRTLKARCVVDLEIPRQHRRCERCASNGLNCVFEEAIARPKRARAAPRARVKDVEEKLDSLIALIAARNGKHATSEVMEASQWPPVVSTAQSEPVLDLEPASDTSAAFFASLGLPYTAQVPEPPTASDVFTKGIVTLEMAQSYVDSFFAEVDAFPMVVRGSHMTLDFLRREKPALLLAIMVCASESPVQDKLVNEFRRVIGQKAIVEGNKSLDLIQGLILFCVWNHRCPNPNYSQLYQLTQLAVTMAVDLGLPQTPPSSWVDTPKPFGPGVTNRAHNPQYWDELERIRTLLGCYFVSHSISICLRKPTHFKHNRRIEQAAKIVGGLGQTATDVRVPFHLRLQRLTQDVENVFQYNDPDGMDEMDAVKIHAMVRSFERQLAEIKASTPPEIWSSNCIQLEYLFLRIYINEIALQVPPGHGLAARHAAFPHSSSSSSSSSTGGDRNVAATTPQSSSSPAAGASPAPSPPSLEQAAACCDWCSSPLRHDVMVSCIRAAHVYMDRFLGLSERELRRVNVMELGRFCYAILVLGLVTTRVDMCGLDSAELARVADVGRYLEASAAKFTSMVTVLDGGKPKRDAFWQLSQLFIQANAWKADLDNDSLRCIDTQCVVNLDFSALFTMNPPRDLVPDWQPIAVQQPTPESPWLAETDADMLWQDLGMPPQDNWFEM